MKELLRYYFTFSGRLSRRRFILDGLKLGLSAAVLIPVLAFLTTMPILFFVEFAQLNSLKIVPSIVCISIAACLLLAFTVASASLGVRRLHDFNYSAWWQLPLCITYISNLVAQLCFPDHAMLGYLDTIFDVFGLCATAVLYFWPGNKEANRFGNSPKQHTVAEVCLATS